MKEKIAEEFYKLTEWLKTRKGTEEVLNDFIDREIGDILDSGNRTAAGPTVPPGGLYMTHLWYDDGVEKFECTPMR